MNSNTLDEPEIGKGPADIMIVLRTGIFLYIAIAETLLTIGMILREILIGSGTEPKNVELFAESTQVVLLLIFGAFLVKKVKSVLFAGEAATRQLLRYCTIVLVATVGISLLYSYYIVDWLPESYWNNYIAYDDYWCINPDAAWTGYYFTLTKYLIIGLLFARASDRKS